MRYVLSLNQQKNNFMKPTLVLGASNNPSRYSFTAVQRLKKYGHEVYPVSIKKGEIDGIEIINGTPAIFGINTVTMYLNSEHQKKYYSYILDIIKPKRIIFNPGAENDELAEMATKKGIEVIEGCTLVMLSVGNY